MKEREKELPFIYLDTQEVITSFLHALLPVKNCYSILAAASVELKAEELSKDQNSELRRIYREIKESLVPTDAGI
jgi:hypothetical protein